LCVSLYAWINPNSWCWTPIQESMIICEVQRKERVREREREREISLW